RNYWEFGDYLGIGAGAHGKITQHDGVTRLAKLRHPDEYMRQAGRAAGISRHHVLDHDDLVSEFLMNALRLKSGFRPQLFTETTGLPVSTLIDALKAAENRGLIERSESVISATETGYRYLNELLLLLP
ncbi:MAG: oxygen-independent coproporphyrinogen III oxidase-like protein, partial [Gammaproteobacteria bacterium]